VGPDSSGLAELRQFRTAFQWLAAGSVPDRLPWGDPWSECGRSHRLSDQAARLMALVIAALEEGPGQLVSLKGNQVVLRLGDPSERALAAAAAESALQQAVGFEVSIGSR
jgi:hypothetical protein